MKNLDGCSQCGLGDGFDTSDCGSVGTGTQKALLLGYIATRIVSAIWGTSASKKFTNNYYNFDMEEQPEKTSFTAGEKAALAAMPLGSLAGLLMNYNSRSMARQVYGDDWKKKYVGEPGSFGARHPIIAWMIPLAAPVSGFQSIQWFKKCD